MPGPSTISERDLRLLLDVVSPEATADEGPELPEQVMRGLADLIPCAAVSFFVMDTRRALVLADQELALANLPEESDELSALFFQAYWDCMSCCYAERYDDHDRVTTWRDFYSTVSTGTCSWASTSRAWGSGTSCWSLFLRREGSSAGSC